MAGGITSTLISWLGYIEQIIICPNTSRPNILYSLQCRRILGGRNLVRVRNIVVAAVFDFTTVEDWGE